MSESTQSLILFYLGAQSLGIWFIWIALASIAGGISKYLDKENK